MKTNVLSLLILFITHFSFAQKIPVGLLIDFYPTVDSYEKKAIIDQENMLMSLQDNHELNGFNITLIEAQNGLSIQEYRDICNRLKLNDAVQFVSILYKTEKGNYGGDLKEVYIKPKSGEWDNDHFNLSFDRVFPHHSLNGVFVAEVNKYENIRGVQNRMMQTGNYDFVSVNTLHTLEVTIDDPYFEYQWALENEGTPIQFSGTPGADMQISDAWDLTTGDPSIKIAVLDSGTDTNHVDLKPNLLPGFDATGGDSEGYPNTEFSSDGHGTCCAGIIAAVGNNAEGTVGIAYDCKVIPVKIFYYVDFGGDVIPFTSSEAGTDGIIWAVNEAEADLISNSWGVRESEMEILGIDTAMSNMVIVENIENGRGGLGTPMLFSSGNEYDPWSIWPASHPMTISVGATSMCDELKSPTDCSPEGWWGSNHGEGLDVTAPGVKVLTTDMSGSMGYNNFPDNNDYSMFNGTSAACPNAAGVMALILSVNPELTEYEARGVLSITADQVGGYDYDMPADFGTRSTEMGYGRVNGLEAVYYANLFSGITDNENDELAVIFYQNGEVILNSVNNANLIISVYDMSGRLISNLKADQANLTKEIGTKGLYIAELIAGDSRQVIRFVLQ